MILNHLPHSAFTRSFYLILGFLIAAAWVLLAVLQQSEYAELLGHEPVGHGPVSDHHASPSTHLAGFLLGWLLMTVAMMLPASLPMFVHSVQPARWGIDNVLRTGGVLLGFLTIYGLFGLLVFVGDSRLHHLTEHGAPLEAAAGWIAPAVVLVAGLYQLTPLKRRCTEHCRPASVHSLAEKISGSEGVLEGLRMGLFCLGSCWSLMLLMSALGHQRLEWMLLLGGIIAVERLAPWGRWLTWMVGVGLVTWAVVLMVNM